MTQEEQYSKPLTSGQVRRLKALPPEADPPRRMTLTLNTFRLPEGAKARIVQVEGSADLFQVQIGLPGDALGRPRDRHR